MLLGEPTKYGAGITLYGDYWDLRNLRDTLLHLSEGSVLSEEQSNFILDLAYDVRHAYEQQRKEKKFYDIVTVTYQGVDILWPIFLTQLGMLRWAASLQPTNKEQQANLFRLEACAEYALLKYDPKIGEECLGWLKICQSTLDCILTGFFYHCTKRYIYETKPGKSRFKKLPEYLSMISCFSEEYRKFESSIKEIAEKEGCKPEELHDWEDWPEFKL